MISLAPDDSVNMNVPPEYWTIERYRATLGYKINHSFKKSNTKFGHAIHPRFGPIIVVIATRNIKKGEELLVDYSYSVDGYIPSWYANAYHEVYGEPWHGEYVYNETDNIEILVRSRVLNWLKIILRIID